MHPFRTHTCNDLRASHVGQTVRLSGWIHRRRDHGGVAFIDLRDHYGITQIVCGPTNPNFDRITRLRAESVITVEGEVIARDPGTINADLASGEIELRVSGLDIQSEVTADLPVPVFGDLEYPEETRLRYRFLDLRRETLHNTILLRSKMIASFRRRMMDVGFTEFQTPILTASSPEGARDFLVPSRVNPGKFYALPQAPQQFKQLLMVAGFDRYFQIAPCFRDEDPRADRSPTDFYQLDVEMSFVTQDDVFATMEPVIAGVFEEYAAGKKVDRDWTRISYADSALWYGTDKPDLRNPIKMQVVSEHFEGSGFAVFAKMLEQPGTQIRAIPAPGGGSRKFCDRMDSFAKKEGLPGMGYIFWRKSEETGDMEAAGPLAKNIGPDRTEAIRQQLGLDVGDAAFFLGGKPAQFERVAGKARMVIGDELGHTEADRFAFAWIVDFPMYEWDEDNKKVDFSHNPFSMPQGGMEALQGQDPLTIKAYQYDLACNGYELLSGGIRNHKPDIMVKAFEIAGYPETEVEARFGGMLNAFKFGAPPHGGCAAGIERMVMLLAGTSNIRDVITFPMNQQAQDLMMGAPSLPTAKQLREL
ncbi:MAG: aspartate--tRNA ligase, partial [Hyphomonadaceae bacterium]|nr:aspartate--tRNA ligase [Hyphomonadaceae bacterium]